MKIAVTGATGYVGSRLITELKNKNHHVIALSRKKPLEVGIDWVYFDLDDVRTHEPSIVCDILIHLAANTKAKNFDPTVEVNAAKRIFEHASRMNTKIVYISSQSASIESNTIYGRIKHEISMIAVDKSAMVIVPGFIYGGKREGLQGLLRNLIAKIRIIPVFSPNPEIYPIHIDIFCKQLTNYIENFSPSIFHIVGTPIGFSNFLETLAISEYYCLLPRIHLPMKLFIVLDRVLPKNLSARLGIKRLMNLNLQINKTQKVNIVKELNLMPCENLQNKLRIMEAKIILSYLLSAKPKHSIIKRYLVAIEENQLSGYVVFSWVISKFPKLLSLIDVPNRDGSTYSEMSKRLEIGLRVVESAKMGAALTIKYETSTKIRSVLTLVLNIIYGLGWRTISKFYKPAYKILRS